jgi:recombination protein RecT
LPFKNKGVMQAQFQIGYRGFIQLAERSGQFKRIGVREVRDEQLIGFDHFGEPLFDFNVGADGEVIGYMAYFELINGFYKIDFMTVAELEKHGKLYSQTYKKGFGVWKDNFAAMAKKTVIKLLLSKWAPLNTEMQKAIEEDQKVEEVYADNKITFEVEGAAINDEPIDIIDVEVSTEDYIVDEPTEADPLKMTDAQRRKAFAIFGKLPDDLKAKAEEGRKTLFGDKSRNDYTRDEANTWINYLQGLEEGKEQNNG